MRLRQIANKDKRIAVCYFKGPEQSSLVATGLEVVPSLYAFLKRLKMRGYNVDDLPATFDEFESVLQSQGCLFEDHAAGSIDRFVKNGNLLWISKSEYENWAKEVITPQKYKEVIDKYGDALGNFMTSIQNMNRHLRLLVFASETSPYCHSREPLLAETILK